MAKNKVQFQKKYRLINLLNNIVLKFNDTINFDICWLCPNYDHDMCCKRELMEYQKLLISIDYFTGSLKRVVRGGEGKCPLLVPKQESVI